MTFTRPGAGFALRNAKGSIIGRALAALGLLAVLLAACPTYAGATAPGLRPPALARLTIQTDGAGLRAAAPAPAAPAVAASAAYRLYLPAVANGARAAEAPSGGGGDFQYSTFLMPYRLNSWLIMSKSPQVAVDARSGVHVAYTSNYPDNSERRPVYYGYCPAACDAQNNFSVVPLLDHVSFAQLAVDPSGRPRLLAALWPPESGFDPILHWVYAECDAGCADEGGWKTVELGSGYWYGSDAESRQTFALDAHGRPRLIFYAAQYNAMVDPSAEMRFMYCDADCADPSQWGTTILSNVGWFDTALAITPDGLPRIAYNSIGDYQLNYVECDTPTCTEGSINTVLTNSSSTTYGGPTFSLKLDAAGNPRMAYYPGLADASVPGGRLYYLACDAGCTSAGTWRGGDIGMPAKNDGGDTILQGAGGVSLALDAQGRPRIAFRMGMGMNELGYAWCDSGCEDGGSGWPHKVIWSSDAQLAEIGTPPGEGCPDCHPAIPPCTGGFWDAGFWPSLALDAAGNPRVAYEIQLQRGGGKCDNATWAHMTRLAVFQQP